MPSDDAQLSRLFGALADPTRRRILEELAARDGQSLFEICARMVSAHGIGLSRQAVSRHLGVLEDAGLIAVAWQGTTKFHHLTPAPLAALPDGWLARFKER